MADDLRVAEQPGDPDVDVVAQGDVVGMACRVERLDAGREGRCVTLYVDGVRTGPLCGLDEPGVPFLEIGRGHRRSPGPPRAASAAEGTNCL